MTVPAPTEPPAIAGGRPPVEFRLLGLDRRTFALPLIVIAVFALWGFVVPQIDNAVDYDDPVRAGDALIIGDTATMAPPVGWGVSSGVRVGEGVRAGVTDPRVAITGDTVGVTTQSGSFAGGPAALVKRVTETDETLGADSAFTAKGSPTTVSVDGRRGVVQEFKTLTGEGAIFAFTENGTGITIVMSGTGDALTRNATKLGRMIASIDFDAKVQ